MSLNRLLPLLKDKYVHGLPFLNCGIPDAAFQSVIFDVHTVQESIVRAVSGPIQVLCGLHPLSLSQPVLKNKLFRRTA